jgi:hypothetical protein
MKIPNFAPSNQSGEVCWARDASGRRVGRDADGEGELLPGGVAGGPGDDRPGDRHAVGHPPGLDDADLDPGLLAGCKVRDDGGHGGAHPAGLDGDGRPLGAW